MTDPYAPPHLRQPLTTSTVEQADAYVRDAVAYVQRSVEAIGKQRVWIEDTCRTLEDRVTALPHEREVDPVVAGLLDHLPRKGAVWPATERKQWLALLEGTFNLIFKDGAANGTPEKAVGPTSTIARERETP
jgi:hypothetical protein